MYTEEQIAVVRKLRENMFAMQTEEDLPSDQVYGILVDWPIGKGTIATIVASKWGDGSLYTNSGFAMIGGVAHEDTRAAAQKVVADAQQYLAQAKVAQPEWPGEDTVFFHLLTKGGLFRLEAPLKEILALTSPYASLFGEAQDLLSRLRLHAQADQRQ